MTVLSPRHWARALGGFSVLCAMLVLDGTSAGQEKKPQELPETRVTGQRPAAPPPPEPLPEPPEPPAPTQVPPAINIQDSRSAPVSNALGGSPSASEGRINQLDLANQPFLRPASVLEYIPGLIAADHTGTTKANEYFLRGFFLDHGTDFSFWIDDVPYNMPNQPHLHGYADINSLIPELVEFIDFRKGVYYAEAGDFSSAGTARIHLVDGLPYGIFKSEFGKNSYFRELVANSDCLGRGTLLYAAEAFYFNGPWDFPENSRLFKGILRYTMGDDCDGLRLTAMSYSGVGRINDQIPLEAVETGVLSRLGTLDPFEGISTQRHQVNSQWWHQGDDGSLTKGNLYYVYYRFNIYTNPSGDFLDPVNGDEFQQFEHREFFGGNLSHSWTSPFTDCVRNTVGLQVRNDNIPHIGINHTEAQNIVNVIDDASIKESNIGLYFSNEVKWGEKVRTVMGLRGDYFHWHVDDILPENSGKTESKLIEPKGSLILGPWVKTEFYLNGGYGFHSNDARGIFNTLAPDFILGPAGATPSATGPANPISRSRGAEVGMKTQTIPNLTTTAALWYLRLESELIFDPFGVTSTPRGTSERYGIELSNTYRLNDWLMLDADYAASHAQFLDPDVPGETHVDQAVGTLFSGGPTVRFPDGLFAGLRYRYLGPRYLLPDGSVSSRATNWFGLSMGYDRQRLSTGFELLNLFDSNGHEIDFANPGSAVAGQVFAGGTSFHPLQPFQARFYFNLKF